MRLQDMGTVVRQMLISTPHLKGSGGRGQYKL